MALPLANEEGCGSQTSKLIFRRARTGVACFFQSWRLDMQRHERRLMQLGN